MNNSTSSWDRDQPSTANLTSWVILIAAIIYFALFGFNLVTRTGRFSPDSMNYVNVARNILAGKGITQPTLGFNQPRFSANAKLPTPLVAEAPLYPLMIAAVGQTGTSTIKSALLVSAVGSATVFFLVYLLAAALYDKNVALVAVGFLLFYHPWRRVTGYAWSEPIGIAFVLLSLFLLAKSPLGKRTLHLFVAGFVTGLAFATRYALLPLVCAGVIFLLVNSRPYKRKLLNVGLYLLGFGIPAGLVLGRNLLVSGSLMPSFNAFGIGLKEDINAIIKALLDGYAGAAAPRLQALLFGILLLLFFTVIFARRDRQSYAGQLFFADSRYLLPLWSFGYLIFLVVIRSSVDLEDVRRLVVPAGITLTVLWSALVVRAIKPTGAWIKPLVLVLLLFLITTETRLWMTTPLLDPLGVVQGSQRLTWIARNTSEQDLIIGDDTMDVPFFLNRGLTISFSPYPNTDRPTYEGIMAYCRNHCNDYSNIYLILSSYSTTEEQWRADYGDFFADLVFGRPENYPDVIPLQQLDDASVFKVRCGL